MRDRLILAVANGVLCASHRDAVRRFRSWTGRYPNIAHPKRFTELMLWRRLVDHNPQFVVFTDKLAAKDYVRRISPDLAVPKTLWIGRDADDIPDTLLSGNVFVKANHGCGFNHPVWGGRVDRAELKQKTDRWLRAVYGVSTEQWAYSQIAPRLFVEQAVGTSDRPLLELCVRASDGHTIFGSVDGHDPVAEYVNVFLDRNGGPMPRPTDGDDAPLELLPEGHGVFTPYRLAVYYAEQLSVGVDYARFDFMWDGTTLYGGEITVYPAGGIRGEIHNSRVHAAFLSGWDLEVAHFLTARQTGLKRIYADALRRQLRRARRGPPPAA